MTTIEISIFLYCIIHVCNSLIERAFQIRKSIWYISYKVFLLKENVCRRHDVYHSFQTKFGFIRAF